MKFDHFFDSSPLFLAILDSNDAFRVFNASWSQKLGYTSEVLERSLFLDIVHSNDRAATETCLRAYEDCQRDLRFLHQDGTEIWVSVQMKWFEDEQEYYITAQNKQNETKHREMLADLESARFYLESIVQTIREPLVVLNAVLCVQTVNRAFYEMFQVSEAETVDHLLSELGNGQWQIPRLYELLDEIIPQSASFENFEIEYLFPMIGWKTMLLNARRIETKALDTPLILLAIEDITARKQAEIDLEARTKELSRSNAELEQFAYVASHDLQEPLRMVVSYMQLLERRYQGKLDQDADEFIGFAVDGATRMQTLINDLLAYSRVGRKQHTLEAIDCTRVLTIVLDNLETSIEETQAVITSDALPTVSGDISQLMQLFQNLLSNGIKFHGDAPPRIHVSAQRDGDYWRFSVHDNGIGIEPQYWERIFLIFERLHSRTSYAGTGIGLAITKKIVERHGGRIWLVSEVGVGTEFLFTLPAVSEREENGRQE